MKILIITGIFPPDIGGPASYVPQIATALAKRGHKVTVVTLSDRLDHDDTKFLFQVIRLPRKIPKPWRWWKTVWTLLRIGRDVDVLFVNGLFMEAVLANILLRKPMVQKVVGDFAWERATSWGWVKDNFEDFQKKRYSLRVRFLKALRAWWTQKADKIIVPSRYLAGWVAKWGVQNEKIAVIYNAVEPPDIVTPANIPLQTPIKVVTVGRLVPWKRIDKLLEVIKRLENVGLVVIGDGPERLYLERLSQELGVTNRVYFAGQKNRMETLGLMAACDIFVLNSTYEGLPHVVLEAMSLGLPVVATAVGGTSELVQNQENGLLIDPDNGRVADTLRQLMKDEGLRRCLGENGQRKVKAVFGLSAMVERTEKVLLEVTRRGRES